MTQPIWAFQSRSNDPGPPSDEHLIIFTPTLKKTKTKNRAARPRPRRHDLTDPSPNCRCRCTPHAAGDAPADALRGRRTTSTTLTPTTALSGRRAVPDKTPPPPSHYTREDAADAAPSRFAAGAAGVASVAPGRSAAGLASVAPSRSVAGLASVVLSTPPPEMRALASISSGRSPLPNQPPPPESLSAGHKHLTIALCVSGSPLDADLAGTWCSTDVFP